jgi:ethanolamine utilization protein EutA
VRVEAGSYRIIGLSDYARAAFAELGIARGPGEELPADELTALLEFYGALLEAVVDGSDPAALSPAAALHVQASYSAPVGDGKLVVTFSGGVGHLLHELRAGRAPDRPTPFGDLGLDLAQWLRARSRWAACVAPLEPGQAGRATGFGLMRHCTSVSGASIFLPRPELLPLCDLPLVGVLAADTDPAHLRQLLSLCAASARGACLRVALGSSAPTEVRRLGDALAAAFRSLDFPAQKPLALLVDADAGKTLGHYATAWGTLPLSVVVLDQIEPRAAQFVRIGAASQQVVPVSFFGLE